MNRSVSKLSTAVALLAIFSTAAAAMSMPSLAVKVDVPFDFLAGNERFTAGTYVFERGANDNLIQVTNSASGERLWIRVLPKQVSRGEDRPTLVFDKYGEDHVLALIKNPANQNGVEVMKGRLARELMAKRKSRVTIAASVAR